MSADLDVIVIGAGVAGLAALSELQRAGKRAICLEARDRIGGRIHTLHDPLCGVPIELGAEFIHGRPPEVWNIARDHRLRVYDCNENSLQIRKGHIEERGDAWLMVDEILAQMRQAAATGPDRTFEEFLAAVSAPEEAKARARSFVEGFNAAHSNTVSIAALAKESLASRSIEGDRAFRILDGYDAVPLALAGGLHGIRVNTVVEGIGWSPGSVSVHIASPMTEEVSTLRAKAALITVGLGVLQTGGIRFDPQPAANLLAARQLCFGQVVRLVMRFREPIWEDKTDFADTGFLLSDGPVFPAWWTSLPIRTPVLVAWSAGPKADSLAACDRTHIIARAVDQLSEITRIPDHRLRAELEQVYYHDWAKDPFSRGAYSFVPAGASDAHGRLAAPVESTLFFAGEATDSDGHASTVHGAIASGRRAAREILAL